MEQLGVQSKMDSLLSRIETPTLILDEAKALRNIARMARKAQTWGVRYRPHFKTHQSGRIGEWFRDLGVEAIAVSSVDMAAYFAEHGWKDITISFPVNVLEIEKINCLAEEVELGLLVESVETVRFLRQNLSFDAHAWIKIDTGYKRTGIWWANFDDVAELAEAIERTAHLSMRGILAHAGHSYGASSREEIATIYSDTASKMRKVQQRLEARGVPRVELSVGDTPTCSLVEDLSGVDEIRPGNLVFYDLKQCGIGSCSQEEVAVAVACPVVAKHEERNEIILYGGAVHLSKDALSREDGTVYYGLVTVLQENGWGPTVEGAYVSSLSQEHGVVKANGQLLDRVGVGDVLLVLPVHSCLTANLLKKYLTLNGEIIEMARIP